MKSSAEKGSVDVTRTLSLPATGSGAARIGRGLRLAWGHLVSWRWGGVLGKLGIGAAGLVLLAVIGRRTAFAGGGQADPLAASPTPTPTATATATPTPTSNASPTPTPAEPAATAPHARATPDDPVFLNSATETDLRRLPGIGPKRAQAILALRLHLGRFRQIEDLLKVKGIGRATLKKLRPIVRLDAPPPAPAASAD